MENWGAVLVAIISGLVLVVTAFFIGLKDIVSTAMSKLNRKLKRKSYVQSVERLAKFLEIFENLKEVKEIQIGLIFHGHNCGGLPQPGKPYTVKAVHGWSSTNKDANPLHWSNFDLQVDGHYIKMLEEVVRNGYSFQVTGKMPIDAKLKMYYESEGVKCSAIYFLGIIESELIYISLGSFETEEYSHLALGHMQLAVDKMRTLISEA